MFEKMCDKNYFVDTNNQVVTNYKKTPIEPFQIYFEFIEYLLNSFN